MTCTNLDPMIALWGSIFIMWAIFMFSSYRKDRDAKEVLMMREALFEFKRLLKKEKSNGK